MKYRLRKRPEQVSFARFQVMILIGVTLIRATPGFGSQPLTLEEALNRFLKESPYIANQNLRVDEADKSSKANFSELLPEVDIRGSYVQSPKAPFLEKATSTEEYALVIRQPLFSGGSDFYTWRASTYGRDLTESDVKASVQQLKFELIQAYIAVLSQEEILRRQSEQIEVLKEQLQVVRTRFEAGSAIISDLRQAEARLAASEGNAALAKSQLDQARANLKRLSGIDASRSLSWPNVPDGLPLESERLFQTALQSNPSIRTATLAIEQEKSKKSALIGQYLPELSAEYRIIERRPLDEDQREHRKELALGVSMNLFNGLKTNFELARQSISVQRSIEALEMMKREIKKDSEEVLSQYKAAQSNLNSLQAAVKSAEEAARAFKLEYQNGTRSLSDLLDAEQDLLQSKVGLVQARYNYIISAFRIRLVSGSL